MSLNLILPKTNPSIASYSDQFSALNDTHNLFMKTKKGSKHKAFFGFDIAFTCSFLPIITYNREAKEIQYNYGHWGIPSEAYNYRKNLHVPSKNDYISEGYIFTSCYPFRHKRMSIPSHPDPSQSLAKQTVVSLQERYNQTENIYTLMYAQNFCVIPYIDFNASSQSLVNKIKTVMQSNNPEDFLTIRYALGLYIYYNNLFSFLVFSDKIARFISIAENDIKQYLMHNFNDLNHDMFLHDGTKLFNGVQK